MPAQTEHPSLERLADFVHGRLASTDQAEIERHVADCESCCRALEQIPDDTLMGHMRGATTPLDAFAKMEQSGPLEDADELPPELRAHPRYRIFKLLGRGGMGEVYLAEHRLMERMVALKVIHRDITQDPQAVERFRIEVKAAARLSHPNIVTAHDAEQAGDMHFLVMEYIEGISLARFVEKRGPLSIVQACNYARQAALGLQHAHEHGMVHRDIKPQNLILTRKGQIKILDFGLARFASDQGRRPTEIGAVIGTPDYIAPEQVTAARQADIRADIYSLGCTLYFLLTGQTPFPRGTQTQKILAHVDRTPQPIDEVRREVPTELVRIIEKTMAKDPGERYQKPAEVAQALAPLTKPPEQSAVVTQKIMAPKPADTQIAPKPKRKSPSRAWLLLGLIPLGLIVTLPLVIWVGWLIVHRGDGGNLDNNVVPPKNGGAAPRPRVLMVLNQQKFWDPDYRPVRAILEKSGAEVRVASSAMTPANPHDTRLGGPVPVDLLIGDARPADFDAVYFAGGMDSDFTGDRPSAIAARKLMKDMLAEKKVVAAQCTGVAILADAGILEHKPAAQSKYLAKTKLGNAKWDPEKRVVVAGTIITGGDFEHGPEFASVLLEHLSKKP